MVSITLTMALIKAMADSGADCISLRDMAIASGMTSDQAKTAFHALRSQGLIKHRRHQCYTLSDAGRRAHADGRDLRQGPKSAIGPTKPRKDSLIQRAWNAMRIKRKFDLAELTILASREEKAARSQITRYCHALAQTGYLVLITAQGPTRGREGASQRYMLIRDTGPHAPRWRKPQREVYDANTGETWPIPAKGVAA